MKRRQRLSAEERQARHAAMLERAASLLPTVERQAFLDLHRRADALIAEGWRLRAEAWALRRPYLVPKVDP